MSKKANGQGGAVKTGAARPPAQKGNLLKGNGVRTLGPVSDLERHLPSEWWRTLFNSLYLETDRNTATEVDLLVRSAGLEVNDRILDLCCGQGRHVLELAKRGYRSVTGVDRWLRTAAPTMGQHNETILGKVLGLPADELDRLAAEQLLDDAPVGV